MDEKIIIGANSKIYNLDVVLKASQAFLDQVYIFLDCDQAGRRFIIILQGKKKLSAKRRKKIKGDFLDSLLHCALRYQIAKNDKKLRDLILGRVLYPAFLQYSADKVLREQELACSENSSSCFQVQGRASRPVFSSLKFNNRIYGKQAIDEAVLAYSDFAQFDTRKDKNYIHVQIRPHEFSENEPLALEFSNYVLALL